MRFFSNYLNISTHFCSKDAFCQPSSLQSSDTCFFTSTCSSKRESLLITSSSSSFEGYPLQVRYKQDWGRGFILLLPQTAVLPGSDAGSDVIKPASSFVIQNRQTSCSMRCPMYRARC